NYCLMQLRKDKQVTKVDIEDNQYESEQKLNSNDENRREDQDFEKLDTCKPGLASEQTQCIRLFYIEQKCYKDIVFLTGLVISIMKRYIQNERRNLKICMEKK